MQQTVLAIASFLRRFDRATLRQRDLDAVLARFLASGEFRDLLVALVDAPVFADDFGEAFEAARCVDAIAPARALRGALNLDMRRFFDLLAQLLAAFEGDAARATDASDWADFAARVDTSVALGDRKLGRYLVTSLADVAAREFYSAFVAGLEERNPHAVYPTSEYRESSGRVASSADDQTIDAVMSVRTFSSIKIVDRSLDATQPALADIYRSLGRCVCLVDATVDALYGEELARYFGHYGIRLEKRTYRALEVDKTIGTVERMLGDFKALGVARNEPVLIVGGGVLADTGGLACALYGRNTPYVMLSTSIVTGIDAGPSPRTCCDGFGYKNLFGAYHPPVVSITDRFFYKTLDPIYLRHGIAEIVKMATVADTELFVALEAARDRLVETRFGTVDCKSDDPIQALSRKILGKALRSYVAVEYGNLYETHQCRPHAYGHTWSPGFEIEAGLLHGHAVSICMGLGAYLSYRSRLIDEPTLHRILGLLDAYGLSLWHDILDRKETIWKSQLTVVQKRGGNLVAPVPKGAIGNCGYLNELSQAELYRAIDEYRSICASYSRSGYGIDALCDDATSRAPALALAPASTA